MKAIKILYFSILFTGYSFAQSWIIIMTDDTKDKFNINQYSIRVNEAGGNIVDSSEFEEQIKLINDKNYLDSLLLWVSSQGGIKKEGDTVKALFDFKGNDLVCTEDKHCPLTSIDPASEYVINFMGSSSLINTEINIDQPFTFVLSFRDIEPFESEYIFNSALNNNYALHVNNQNKLTVEAKKKLSYNSLTDKKNVVIAEFNGDNSRLFVNNELVTSGKLEDIPLQGILLGKNNKNNPDYFTGYLYTCGIFKSVISDSFRTELYNVLK